jgi:hypothetical protein
MPVGSLATVTMTETLPPPQGLTIHVTFDNGGTAVFDEQDSEGAFKSTVPLPLVTVMAIPQDTSDWFAGEPRYRDNVETVESIVMFDRNGPEFGLTVDCVVELVDTRVLPKKGGVGDDESPNYNDVEWDRIATEIEDENTKASVNWKEIYMYRELEAAIKETRESIGDRETYTTKDGKEVKLYGPRDWLPEDGTREEIEELLNGDEHGTFLDYVIQSYRESPDIS